MLVARWGLTVGKKAKQIPATAPSGATVRYLLDRRFGARGRITDELDDVVDAVVGGYMAARPAGRMEILEQVRGKAASVLYSLATVRHGAARVRTSIPELVDVVREYLSDDAANLFLSFHNRYPRSKSLGAFGLAACGSGADFRYGYGTTSSTDEDGLCGCRVAEQVAEAAVPPR